MSRHFVAAAHNEGKRFAAIVFGRTRTRFPLHIRSTRELTITEAHVVTAIGKAFGDVGHAPKDQSNRRKRLPQYAVWEIHPVMKLTVQ